MIRTIENDFIAIIYRNDDDSFIHEFGCEKVTSYHIIEAQAYIPALDAWIDVSQLKEFEEVISKLIEKNEEVF